MIKNTPQDIAKYFRESITFDFKRESISSYHQIESDSDSFYTLVDREAFSALLNDSLGYDNQLKDVFLDIFDSELGIHCFANKAAQNSPRARVTFFLNKYQYHRNDIAKVYLAFNTWLEFFGCGTIKPEWSKCPFCGSALKPDGSACSSRTCKKTAAEFVSVASELANLLSNEQAGIATPTPAYWSSIKEGSEFYTEYKLQIENFKNTRNNAQLLKEETKKTAIIDVAVKELNSIAAQLVIEVDKEIPDFDGILKKIAANPAVVEANKYSDKTFSKKVSDLKDKVANKRAEYESSLNEKQKIENVSKNVNDFLSSVTLMEREMSSESLNFTALKALFEKIDTLYNKLITAKKSGYKLGNASIEEAIKKYETDLRGEVVAFVNKREHEELIKSIQAQLITQVNLVLNKFNGVRPSDDKSGKIAEFFNEKIETNKYFDAYRLERRTQYVEITNPVRVELSKLIQAENDAKIATFSKHCEEIINDVYTSEASQMRSSTFISRVDELEVDEYYASIRGNGDVKRMLDTVREKISLLSNDESIYAEGLARERRAKARKKRKRKATFISLTILILLTVSALFIGELGGYLPIAMALPGASPNLDGTLSYDRIILNGTFEEEKDLVIPSSTRLKWSFKEGNITRIADNAFSKSSVLSSVTIPSTVSIIGKNAFASCPNLKRVVLLASAPPTLYESAFANSDVTFYVPESNYDAYLMDSEWSRHSERIFPIGVDKNTGSVILHFNDGTGATLTENYPLHSTLTSLPTPERYGHVFMGWYYLENEKKVDFDVENTVFDESLKLYAAWEIGDYTVSFDYQGGTVSDSKKVVKYSDKYGKLPTTEREGYTFDGWFINGVLLTKDSIVDISTDVTAVAKWTANNYAVAFNYNGGSVSTENKKVTYDVSYGELPVTERLGYVFLGWYLGDNKIESTSAVSTSEDHTLVARWRPIRYKISYSLDGGQLDGSEVYYDYDETFTIATPKKDGYTFEHWMLDNSVYVAAETVTNLTAKDGAVLIFRAVWTANVNTVVYDAHGGTGYMQNTKIATDASDHLLPCGFTRDGYTFKGWSTMPGGEVEYLDKAVYTMSYKETNVLYAVWAPLAQKVVLHYVLDGEILATEEIHGLTGETVVLGCKFERSGYGLSGWSTTAGGDYVYSKRAYFELPAYTVVLYALWEPNNNSLVFDRAGGTGSMESLQLPTATTVTLPKSTFTKYGYTFKGWSTTRGGEVEYADGAEYTMGTDYGYTLYAVWEIETYVIDYYLGGGTNDSTNPKSYNVTSQDIVLTNPTRKGYTFGGWYADEALTIPSAIVEAGSVGEKVFYAKWSANSNVLHFNANGAEGSMNSITVLTDQAIELPSNQFIKLGYTFIGWKKSDDPNEGATYSNGANYVMGAESEYTLYAVWALNVYSVNYELGGGIQNSQNPESYTVESNTVTLLDPTRVGYTFSGWYSDVSFTSPITEISAGSTGNLTLYAKWEANQNTLYFDPNGAGGEIYSITVPTDALINLPDNPFVREGYTFLGWKNSNSINEGAAYYNNGAYQMGTNASYTLYAVWALDTYSISYETGGGTNSDLNPSFYSVESGVIVLSNPTKAGYTFIGWYLDSAFTRPIVTIESGSVGNRTLYAKWQANINAIYFDANGGVGTMIPETATTGSTITLPANAFYRDGYQFAGWSLAPGASSVYADQAAYSMGAQVSVTLYAVWTQTKFTVQYNLDGGINSTANPYGYNSEAATVILSNPTKTGNTFAGWYTDAAFQNQITEITNGSTGDLVLYAKWIKNVYTVTFDYNGGTGSVSTNDVTYSEAYGTLPEATRKGYTFLGWYLGETHVSDDSTVILASNHTLVAKWSRNKWTVSFSADGGTGNISSKEILYGDPYGTLPTLTKTGHTFDGWYYNGTRVTAETLMLVDANHILMPVWTPVSYTVYFNYNGGNGGVSSMTVTYGKPYGTLPTASNTGYSYKWYYGSTVITSTTTVTEVTSHTLVAKWTPNEYIIYIKENNVDVKVIRTDTNTEVTSGSSVPYNTPLKISCTTNSGYHDGWCDYAGETITMPAGDLTINSGATQDDNSCLAQGTQILLPGGKTIGIEHLRVGDAIMTYDHATGELVESTVAFTFYVYKRVPILTLSFANGTEIKLVNVGHGFYDVTLDEYVLLSTDSVEEYVGHSFAFVDGEMNVSATELVGYSITYDMVGTYDVASANNLNHIANGLIACSDTLVGISNTFDFDGMVYDEEKMLLDIEEYGVYSYDEWSAYVTYEEFTDFNGQYFKIAIAKGLLTYEELYGLIYDIRSLWQ